jgi:hypothetical protein
VCCGDFVAVWERPMSCSPSGPWKHSGGHISAHQHAASPTPRDRHFRPHRSGMLTSVRINADLLAVHRASDPRTAGTGWKKDVMSRLA